MASRQDISRPAGIHPYRTKCEFCDIAFHCDLDASKHLNTSAHAANVKHYVSQQNLTDDRNKEAKKQIPKDIVEVFQQTMRIREPKDLKDLADKGYFDINEESLANIGEELVAKLVKAIFEFDARILPAELRKSFIAALNSSEDDEGSGAEEPEVSEPAVEEPEVVIIKEETELQEPPKMVYEYDEQPAQSSPTEHPTSPVPYTPYLPTQSSGLRPSTSAAGVPSTSINNATVNNHKPRTSTTSGRPDPQPDPNSTYKPVLAKVKFEPAD